jgi:hypothetical protein
MSKREFVNAANKLTEELVRITNQHIKIYKENDFSAMDQGDILISTVIKFTASIVGSICIPEHMLRTLENISSEASSIIKEAIEHVSGDHSKDCGVCSKIKKGLH